MPSSLHQFVADQYGPRASDYLQSPVHASGDDLDQIEALLKGNGSARVLDVGCGAGHVSMRAARHVAEVIACDIAPAMLDVVRQAASRAGLANIAVQEAAAECLPFPASSFDFVVSRFSAHHWADLHAGLREMARVLGPEGQAVLVDTIAPADPLLDTHLQTIELLRDQTHVRNYTLAEWSAALAAAGLTMRHFTPMRLRLEFASWVARTRTDPVFTDAIHALQARAPATVLDYFETAARGDFTIDTMLLVAAPLGQPQR